MPNNFVQNLKYYNFSTIFAYKRHQNTQIHSSVVLSLISAIEKQKLVFSHNKMKVYSKLSVYQTLCTCPCCIYITVIYFALNLQLLHPNNWPTMVYRISQSFFSCKHSAHTKTKPRLVLHFSPGLYFLLTDFIPTIHPNYLFRFCLLWIYSITLQRLFFFYLHFTV